MTPDPASTVEVLELAALRTLALRDLVRLACEADQDAHVIASALVAVDVLCADVHDLVDFARRSAGDGGRGYVDRIRAALEDSLLEARLVADKRGAR